MKKPTILCVDDEAIVLKGLQSQLERQFGSSHAIELAESGEEALEILEDLPEDEYLAVVISDQLMPGMKGHELLVTIHAKHPTAIKILLTGQADAAAIGEAVNNANLYRYITKPWNQSDLILTVSEALKSYGKDRLLDAQNKKLMEYNEQLEQRVKERTAELNKQNEKLVLANHQIVSSINHAFHIQQAVLPNRDYIQVLLKEHFIFFLPKNIVSGDFYWFKNLGHKALFAIGDCTGHGVPGAFMTLLGISSLNEISSEAAQLDAGFIFSSLQAKMKNTFRLDCKRTIKESMEICVCMFDTQTMQLQFAGTPSSFLFIVPALGNSVLQQIDGQKTYECNGKKLIQIRCKKEQGQDFYQKHLQLERNDQVYIFTDGYIDQIGGANLRRYMRARFAEMVLRNSHLPLDNQLEMLKKEFSDWKASNTQTDDVLVFGFKI